jgi:hypothetical protein
MRKSADAAGIFCLVILWFKLHYRYRKPARSIAKIEIIALDFQICQRMGAVENPADFPSWSGINFLFLNTSGHPPSGCIMVITLWQLLFFTKRNILHSADVPDDKSIDFVVVVTQKIYNSQMCCGESVTCKVC